MTTRQVMFATLAQERASLPTTLCTLRAGRVVELSLQNGGMQGTVPPELGNMSALTNLYLDANALSGTLSSNLAHAPLTFLTAAQNSLSGSIPA